MARIRCIKPEFPQSESMGNVSRDSRLTFILLWTIADDEGRLRGNSRMLASLLFPYDDDAPSMIDGWLHELEKEGCIYRYKVDSQSYIEIRKWLIHQKIDKPSKSKITPFSEDCRILANPRESSSEDLRIKDQGSKDHGVDQGKDGNGSKDNCRGQASTDTIEVFDYWKSKLQHPQAKLDAKREKALKARLKDGYTVSQLCQAIDGCSLSPWHLGQNDRNQKFDDLELICRDAGRVDRFIEIAKNPPLTEEQKRASTSAEAYRILFGDDEERTIDV